MVYKKHLKILHMPVSYFLLYVFGGFHQKIHMPLLTVSYKVFLINHTARVPLMLTTNATFERILLGHRRRNPRRDPHRQSRRQQGAQQNRRHRISGGWIGVVGHHPNWGHFGLSHYNNKFRM